jgi:hypothetical protein
MAAPAARRVRAAAAAAPRGGESRPADGGPASPLLALQRSAGNLAVQQMLQPGGVAVQRDEDEGGWLGALAGLAGDAGAAVSGYVGDKYAGMKRDAASVHEAGAAVDSGIDWLEDQARRPGHWLAEQAAGIPVLEQVADAGASVADGAVDLHGGVLKGANTLLGGLAGAVANPVDTAAGLAPMAEHVPGLGAPLKSLHGAWDLAFGDESAQQVFERTNDPLADAKYWGGVGSALWAPYARSIEDGKPFEALGRGAFDIGSLLIGAGETRGAVTTVETSMSRLEHLAEIADSGAVRGVATDAELQVAWERAQATRRGPSPDTYDKLRSRMNTQIRRGGGVPPSGDWHHWLYQEIFPEHAMDPANLFPTERTAPAGSAIEQHINAETGLPYEPHTQLHQVTDVPGTSRFQQMADWAMPTEVRDMFNFWNNDIPLSEVADHIDDFLRRRGGP